MRSITLVLLIGVTFSCLMACGQKGPLYLPNPEKAASKPTPKYIEK